MFRLNLAALTDDELQAVLGPERALALLPEVSAARLGGRALPGPEMAAALHARPLTDGPWGGTPEQTRALAAEVAALEAAGAQHQGTYCLTALAPADHAQVYTLADTVLALRWAEDSREPPFLQALTWLRDRASGLSCVLSVSGGRPLLLSPSEELDLRHLPGAGLPELLEAHRHSVARHGRPRRLPEDGPHPGWLRAWQELYDLNMAAWERRGLLLPAG